MPNNHGYVNATKMCSWNVDALVLAGVYEGGDLDNGVLVTLGAMNQSATNNIQGYEFAVTPATADSVGVCIVDTPAIGTTVEMQEMADPRYFYNQAGKTLGLRRIVPKYDYLELIPECFVDGTLPTAANSNVIIAAGGKFQATNADQSGTQGAYFSFVGYHTITFGMETVQTAVVRCERN